MRKTKIVCTIGPAVATPTKMRQLIKTGMDVARLNFSHGTYESHTDLVKKLRNAAEDVGKEIAILQDLQGPKIRVGWLPEEGIRLENEKRVVLTTEPKAQYDIKKQLIPVTYSGMHEDLKKGDRLLLDDGLLELEVEKIEQRNIICRVLVGGLLTSHKSINAPTATLNIDPLTEKDREDLAFGLKLGVDWIALSFVTDAAQVKNVRRLIDEWWRGTGPKPKIIVKVEKHEAIQHIDEIIATADGIMVARGDLGIETPAARVPIEQKRIIQKCRAVAKPVIVATQMLDSMIRNPRPTRAEISDIANAVLDHTDACMLSGETATGKYPIEAVKVMADTIEETEHSRMDAIESVGELATQQLSIAVRVESAARLVLRSGAKTLVILTKTGEKVRMASALRQEVEIVAVASSERLARQLLLFWGVRTCTTKLENSQGIARMLMKKGLLTKDESYVALGFTRNSAGELMIR